MKKLLPFLLVSCLMLTGCETDEESSSTLPSEIVISSVPIETVEESVFPVEVCGVEIAESAKRSVSLSPAVTEIMAELGYTAKLRGISSYCDYPELTLQTVGSSENPDIDVILGLSPDVVFTLSGLSERDIYSISNEGAAVICLEPPVSIEGYGRLYSDIASVFAGEQQGKAAGESAVKALTAAAEKTDIGSFIYVTDKLTAAGAVTFEDAVLSLSGSNICTADGYAELLSLSEAAPEYIVASDRLTLNDISADDTLAAMISDGAEVVFVTAQRFERPSARTADVFSQIADQLSDDTSETE